MTRIPVLAASLLFLFAWPALPGAPSGLLGASRSEIASVRLARRTVDRFTVLEAQVRLAAGFADPFDSGAVRVDALVTPPDARTVVVPAYYASGDRRASLWLAKYVPDQVGEHTLRVRLQRGAEEETSGEFTFKTRPSAADGFLRLDADSSYLLKFDSGKPFRGVGINMGWELQPGSSTVKYTYDFLFQELAKAGCNFVRTWMCPWNLPLEWKDVPEGKYRDDDQTYNRSAIKRLDELVALAERHGIYLILTLDYHGALRTKPDEWGGNNYWTSHPYNRVNGGPCGSPVELFTNADARRLYRSRLRYLVARWGHSTHICAWEFWNEVDHLVEDEQIAPDVIVAWHREMAAYLRELDPQRHLVTTSVSHQELPGLFDIKEIDFTQTHLYGKTAKFRETIAAFEAKYAKPYVVGEFALDWKSPREQNPTELETELHLGLWRGLFSPTPVVPLTWWWEHFHSRGEFSHLKHVAAFQHAILQSGAPVRDLGLDAPGNMEMAGLRAGDATFVWVRNRTEMDLEPGVFPVRVPDSARDYRITFIDPRSGRRSAPVKAAATDGRLSVQVPRLAKQQDLAAIIVPAS